MRTQFQECFASRWKEYFADSELPICYYYTDDVRQEDRRESASEHRCLIGNLNRVRQGFPYVYDAKTPGCPGGKRYSGFATDFAFRLRVFPVLRHSRENGR
jgi:hypothetical protein